MSSENANQFVYPRRPRTRSVARRERQEAAQKFAAECHGDGSLDNPYLVDGAPPGGLVVVESAIPLRQYTTGPPPGFPFPIVKEEEKEDDKEAIRKFVRRNIQKDGGSTSGAK